MALTFNRSLTFPGGASCRALAADASKLYARVVRPNRILVLNHDGTLSSTITDNFPNIESAANNKLYAALGDDFVTFSITDGSEESRFSIPYGIGTASTNSSRGCAVVGNKAYILYARTVRSTTTVYLERFTIGATSLTRDTTPSRIVVSDTYSNITVNSTGIYLIPREPALEDTLKFYNLNFTADTSKDIDISSQISSGFIVGGGFFGTNDLVFASFTHMYFYSAPTPTNFTKVSGDNQSGNVSSELARELVVKITDQNDNAIVGQTVTFSSTTGATVSPTSVETDEDGEASTSVTFGANPGTFTITAATAGLTSLTFTATAIRAVATTLEKISGDGQSATLSARLTDNLVVRVLDQQGNPFAGSTVTFSVSPTATLTPLTVVTNNQGVAATVLTLGPVPGEYTVTAMVSGLDDVTFTATAERVPNPGLPFLRDFAMPGGHTIFRATSSRTFLYAFVSGTGVVPVSFDGTIGEVINIPATGTLPHGLTHFGGTFYLLFGTLDELLPARMVLYNESAEPGTPSPIPREINRVTNPGITLNSRLRDIEIRRLGAQHGVYILYTPEATNLSRVRTVRAPSGQQLSSESYTLTTALGTANSFVFADDGFYVTTLRSKVIYFYDLSFTRVPTRDINTANEITDFNFPGFTSIGWTGNSLAAFTDDHIYLYGVDPPVEPTDPTLGEEQFKRLERFTERFDIVRQSGQTFVPVVSDIECIRETMYEYISITSDQNLGLQLNNVIFYPKRPILGIKNNDTIFEHLGDAGVDPAALPPTTYTVTGVSATSDNKRQIIYAELDVT